MAGKPPLKTRPVIIGDMALININGRRGNGQYAIVDLAALPLVEGYNWSLSHGYAIRAGRPSRGSKKVFMHHAIVGKKQGLCVDHINHLRLDNRRGNLRHTTMRKNLLNTSTFTKSWSNKYLGVRQRGNSISGRIRINGKETCLGTFPTAEDAFAAVQKVREKLIE